MSHDDAMRTVGQVSFLEAEHCTVVLADEELKRAAKVLQLTMRRRTGAIFAQVPYLSVSGGLVGACEVKVDAARRGHVRLSRTGKVTTQRVKYSHPIDGRAHFSQDGRVQTRIWRQSIRLDTEHGPLFSLHAIGLGNFDPYEPHRHRPNRLYVPFGVLTATESILIEGHWLPFAWLQEKARERGAVIGPVADLPLLGDQSSCTTFLLRHPHPTLGATSILGLTASRIRSPAGAEGSSVLLMGGWSRGQFPVRPEGEVGFLAFSYPCTQVEELTERLGSIDYDPAAAKGEHAG